MLRAVLPPLVTAYAILVAMILRWRRRPVPRSRPWGPPPPATRIALVVAAGYGAFLAIVMVFHVWLAAEADAFGSAVRGGGFLALVSIVGSTIAATLDRRRRRPHTR